MHVMKTSKAAGVSSPSSLRSERPCVMLHQSSYDSLMASAECSFFSPTFISSRSEPGVSFHAVSVLAVSSIEELYSNGLKGNPFRFMWWAQERGSTHCELKKCSAMDLQRHTSHAYLLHESLCLLHAILVSSPTFATLLSFSPPSHLTQPYPPRIPVLSLGHTYGSRFIEVETVVEVIYPATSDSR